MKLKEFKNLWENTRYPLEIRVFNESGEFIGTIDVMETDVFDDLIVKNICNYGLCEFEPIVELEPEPDDE